ncbi:MAG: hypothetical protein N3G80_01505 [Candidatus Micrarchaeota archaeon]|nr:hypothetical protein [Candidatus Micrarchaeota archaeon]
MSLPAQKITRLFEFCIAPKKGERILFISDFVGKAKEEHEGRALLIEYCQAMEELCKKRSCRLLPIVLYEPTGKHNADLPPSAETIDGGHVNDLKELIKSCNVVVAINKYSATAPLKNLAKEAESLRCISMPGFRKEMEAAMLVDYERMAKRAERLLSCIRHAIGFELIFDGKRIPRGTKLHIDTRANNWIVDAGVCREAGQVINLPSGEVFSAPYEGISPKGRMLFGKSNTAGILPIYSIEDERVAFLHVNENRIVKVEGDCTEARRVIENIAKEKAAANIAEIGFGINENARGEQEVPIVEREKAGPHVAYGRNDHFGSAESMVGKVSASVHVDYVYTEKTPITATVYAHYQTGNSLLIAQRGKIVI